MTAEDDPRARTELVSNAVILEGLDGTTYLQWLRSRAPKIETIIPQFMHEVTHHWCFNSLVGRALALIRLRSQIALVMDRPPVAPSGVDITKYEVAKILLGPLAEGMALFAEYDLVPRASPIVSQTSMATTMCFGFVRSADPERAANLSLQALLQNSRMNVDFLHERKAPTYLRPFDVEDAYLPGYLALKNLYARVAVKAQMLRDHEAFLCYVREVVYNDTELVRRLLEPHEDEIEAARAVIDCIHTRLRWLAESDEIGRDADGFVEYVIEQSEGAAERAPTRWWIPGLGWDDTRIPQAATVIDEQLSKAMTLLNLAVEREEVIASVLHSVIYAREFVVVASAPVRVKKSDGKLRAEIDGVEVAAFDEGDDAFGGESAHVVAVLPSSAGFLALVLTDGDSSRVVSLSAPPSDAELEGARSFAVMNSLRRDVVDLFATTAKDYLDGSALSIVRNHARTQSIAIATRLYATLATLVVPDEDCELVKSTLTKDGFKPFFGGDVRIAKVLAAVGIGQTINADVSMLCHFVGPRVGVPTEQMERGLSTLRELKPYPLVYGDADRIYAVV